MRYDRESIQAKLRSSPHWRQRALAMLYAEQTVEERAQSATIHHNGRGFSESDARRLSLIARASAAGRLTRNMDITLCLALPKYWRQVVEAIARAQGARLLRAGKTFVEIADA